ncbi:hypothetical protein REPUB_Repub08aG0194500 [Reevesia pubescens]
MRLVGIVSILMFLSFLGAILNLLLLYLSPFIYEVQRYLNDFLHQFAAKAGLIFIVFQVIIATILRGSILKSDKLSAGYRTYELYLLEEKEEIEESSKGNVDDNDDHEEFSMQEICSIKENDVAYSKVASGNNVNVKGDHTSLDENPSGHEIKEKVEEEKMCGIRVEDGEGNEDVKILETRIEEFIARSHQRWKQELVEEKLDPLAIENESSYYLTNRVTEAQPIRKVMPGISRPKNANNKIRKKKRLHTIRMLIKSMQTKAKMIKMRSQYAISTKKNKYNLLN